MQDFEAEVAKALLRCADDEINEKGKEIEALLAEVQKEKDDRKEERFLWIVAVIVLIDAYVFMNMESWTGPLVLFALELVILFPLAQRLGVQRVIQVLDRIAYLLPSRTK